MNPTNHKDSLNIRIRGNSYEYTWYSVRFGQNRKGTVTNNNLFGNTARKLQNQSQISSEYVECMHSRLFLTIHWIFSHDMFNKAPSMLPGHQSQNEYSS